MSLWQKLQVKPGAFISLNDPYNILETLPIPEDTQKITLDPAKTTVFVSFVNTLAQVKEVASKAKTLKSADPFVWIAYPKGTSKKYTCEFNRDTGWQALGDIGYEPVRQVAIDEDWSALRFRKVGNIKTMTRSFAMTKEGKEKVEKGRK